MLVRDWWSAPELNVWHATERGVEPFDVEWRGPSFASLYSQLAEAFDFSANDDEIGSKLSHAWEARRMSSTPQR